MTNIKGGDQGPNSPESPRTYHLPDIAYLWVRYVPAKQQSILGPTTFAKLLAEAQLIQIIETPYQTKYKVLDQDLPQQARHIAENFKDSLINQINAIFRISRW